MANHLIIIIYITILGNTSKVLIEVFLQSILRVIIYKTEIGSLKNTDNPPGYLPVIFWTMLNLTVEDGIRLSLKILLICLFGPSYTITYI